MPSIYNPLLGRHQDVSDADAQYLAKPLGGDSAGTRMVRNPLDNKLYPVSSEEYDFLSKPGRTLADTVEPPPMQERDAGVDVFDYGKSVMSGGASLAQGFGWLTRQVGAGQIGASIEELGRNAVDYWTDSLSDGAKDALSREFVRRNEGGDWEWGDPTLHTVGLTAAQSLLGTAAGMGAGAGVSKVLQLFANPLGRSVLASAAASGSVQAARKLALVDTILTRGISTAVGATKRLRAVDAVIGALGFGAGEGLVSAMQSGQAVESAVRLLPPETLLRNPRYQQVYNSTDERLSELERHQYATDTIAKEAGSTAGWQTGLVTALLGAPMGAFFGRILGESGRLASSRAMSTLVGAAGEAGQEALQSGAESAIGTATRQRVGEQDLDLLESAINEAIGGAAAGGLLGGTVGAVDFKPEVSRETDSGVKPPITTDTATPLKNAAMRAAEAGADRDAVLAEVQANDRPLIDRIAKLNQLASQAAAAPPAEPAAPTYRDVLEPAPTDTPPKQRVQPTPLDVQTPVDAIAHRAATSPLNPTTPPTPEQIDAENYEAARVPGKDVGLRSLDLVVEYPRGVQRGDVTLRNHYGRIPGTVGGDGMALDFFLGNEDTDTVYLYHTLDSEGRFAQHKALVNMSRAEAEATLEEFYNRPPGANGTIVELSKPQFEQWVASGNLGAPHPDAGITSARRFEGAPTRAVTPAGQSINARYALVEAGDLTSSHTLTGKPNSRFPQELQPRDRSRAGLRQWIVETANRFEPALVTEGIAAGEGAPVVGPDGVIESGNGRAMLITKLYLDKNPVYRQYLEQNAERFGFKKEQVDQLARPMLVRVRQDAMDLAARARFATEANRPTLSTFSATEQANADAKLVGDQDLAAFAPDESGNVLAASNQGFVRSFIGQLPATERAGLMTSDGQPTRQLAQRIQAAVFAKAYQDNRLLTLMAEEANPDVRNVVAALTTAAPAFARARAAGALEQAPVLADLSAAVDLFRQARAKGQSIDEVLGQGGLFGATPPAVERLVRFLDANNRSAKRMGEAFRAIAEFLEYEATRRQSGSLFEEAPLTVDAALAAANQRMSERYDAGQGQGALFSRAAPEAEALRDLIEEYGEPVQNSVDAERRYSDGDVIYAFNEMDGEPSRVDSLEMLRSYPYDLLVAVPQAALAPRYSKQAFVQTQRGWTIAQIYEHAVGNQARLAAILNEVAATFGVEVKNPGIKSRSRLEAKAANEGYADLGDVVDVVRGAILAESVEQSDEIVAMLQTKLPVYDKGVQVTPSGYADRKVLLKFSDGQVGEVQIAPPSIFDAKYAGGGEALYMEQRALLKDGVAVDPERYEALRVRQIELYAHAVAGTPWEPAVAGAGFAEVNQALNRSRQAASPSTPASASTAATSALTQPAPGEGMTNAPSPPEASVPTTAGRSSNATNERTVLTGRSTESSIARARVARVREWIQPHLKALEPILRVEVVDDVSELPYPEAPPDVEGAYTQDRQVYLVAKNLPTEARVMEVLRHEAFGHAAIERMGKLKVRLEAINRAIRAGNLKPLVKEVRARQGLLPAMIEAREVVALMAERGQKSPLLDGFRRALREVGRDLGFAMPVDERELNALVRTAAKDLRRDAAIVRDFQAARGRPAVDLLEQKAEPTDREILAALDELYGPSEDLIDAPEGGTSRMTPSGKLVPLLSRAGSSTWYHGSSGPLQQAELDGEMYFIADREAAKFWGPHVERAAVAPRNTKTLRAPQGIDPVEYWDNIRGPEEWQGEHDAIRVTSEGFPDMLVVRDAAQSVTLYSRAATLPGAVPNGIEALLERVMAPPSDAVTIKDRARQSVRKLLDVNADAIRQGVIDSFDSVKQLEKGQFGQLLDAAQSPYKAALATRNLPSVMAAVMLRGVPVYEDGAFQLKAGRKGIIEIFSPVTEHPDGNLLQLWELYAAAYRERDVMRTKKDYKPLFSNDERQNALDLAKQYPVLEEARREWQAFNGELLDLAVERGVLDAEAAAAWKQNFYVPFYRAMEEAATQGPGTKRGLEGHGGQAVKKRLRGSDKPLGAVFENLVMNTAYLIDESFKNTAMQKIAAMAEGVAMERIPLKWDAVQLPAGQLEKAINELGGMVLGFKADATSPTGASWSSGLSAAEREEWVKLFRRVAPVGKDVVSVFQNGKPVYYRVTDELLLRSIGNMGFDNFEDVFGLFRGSKRLLTSAITMDPAFMLANWARDTLSTWVSSDAGITPVVDALKGAKAAFSMDSDLLAMMAAGAGGGGIYDMQPAQLRQFLIDKLGSESAATRFGRTIVSPKNWLRLWRKIGNAAENANRVAVYKAVRKAGGTVAEAAYQARDVLNFSMHGDYAAMRWLTATVPFMNARVQGLYRLWRGAADNPKSFALKGLMLTAATLALLLRNNDEEEYEQLSEWDKDMYWHFWVGGEHYRLPKPFEVGAIFGTIPERMYRLGTGRDSADIVKQRIMSMVGDTFAFNPIPQVAKPLIEQYANRSFFFGSPIVGMAELNLNPEAQYTPWTSESMKLLAEALPDFAPAWLRSPQRLEAMLRGYLGATGMYALQAADTLARPAIGAPPRPASTIYDAPIVKRFLQSPNPRYTKYADQLYDMLEEANAIFRTVNRYREQGRTEDAAALVEQNKAKLAARGRLNRITTQVRSINNQIQLLMYNGGLSAEVKRERIDALIARKNELTALVAPLADSF